MAFSFCVALFWLFGGFILDEEEWKLDKKSGAEFRIIQEAEHQKLGTSKKQKGSSHCSDLQSTYICVWNIAM